MRGMCLPAGRPLSLIHIYMPTGEYFIISDPLHGKFSNSATTNSEVTAYLFCQNYSDVKEPFIRLRMYEYDSYIAKNVYSSDEEYDIIMMDGAGVKHNLTGYMFSQSSDIRIVDDVEIATVINALKEGGTVRFAIAVSYTHLDVYKRQRPLLPN